MKTPIKGFIKKSYPEGSITQWFGENPDLYRRWGLAYHNGIDIVAPWGTPIYAVEGGTVVKVKDDPSGHGKHVITLCNDMLWGYAHLSEIDVELNQKIKEGDQIGLMGNTGFVISGPTPFWEYNPYAGTHLHIWCRRFVEESDGWKYKGAKMPRIEVLNYNNGVKGAINPAPYLVEDTDDIRQKQLTVISLLNQVISLYKQLLNKK